MIDSTNPRILANNIRKLFAMVKAIVPGTVVEGNPTGSGYTNLLKKIKIGTSKYKLPDEVTANPEDAATLDLEKLKVGESVYKVAPASNYSTTEKKIGTWIDGSDLYEKTVVTNAAVSLVQSEFRKIPFAEGEILTNAGIMFITNIIDSNWIRDTRPRFRYNSGTGSNAGIVAATSQDGGQTLPSGTIITIRYTKITTE